MQNFFVSVSNFKLSHWDSLLLAACADAGVTRLRSEDMLHGADIDGVKIINPVKTRDHAGATVPKR